jgi:hypothetical protein
VNNILRYASQSGGKVYKVAVHIVIGIISVISVATGGGITIHTLKNQLMRIILAESSKVSIMIPMLMSENPSGDNDFSVLALIQSFKSIIEPYIVVIRVSAAIINDKGAILKCNYVTKAKITGSIAE